LLLQKGHIGKAGFTIGHVARQMYRAGYDFRHFMASSVPVLLAEAIVRIAFFARTLHEGGTLADAVPTADNPRLRGQLFWAHSVAAGINAGKVGVSKNPLTINQAQWMALARYALPQFAWWLGGQERARAEHVEVALSKGWDETAIAVEALWAECFDEEQRVML
jgi:hypothetical protein